MDFVLLLLICALVQNTAGGYLYIYDKQPWRVALNQCMRKGDGFTFPLTGTGNHEGVQGLATWLPIRRIRYPTWVWLDNQRVGSWFEKQNWGETMNCGVTHLRDGMLEADQCNRVKIGILCESEDEQSCNMKHKDMCHTIHGRTFYYECGSSNWYGAKFRCHELNMTLAAVKSKDMARALKALYRQVERTCIRVWVGLRREDWLHEAHRGEVTRDFRMPWALGEPASDGNCAVSVGYPDSGSLWKVVVCGANYHWLCIQNKAFQAESTLTELGVHDWTTKIYSLKADVTIGQTNPSSDEERAGNKSGIIAGVVVLIILLVAMGLITAMIIRKRRQQKSYGEKEAMTVDEVDCLTTNIQGFMITENSGQRTDQLYKCTEEEGNSLKIQTQELITDVRLDVTSNKTLKNSKEIVSEEENLIKKVCEKPGTQINTKISDSTSESIDKEAMEIQKPDITMTGNITSKGASLSSSVSDISFIVPEESVADGEEQQVNIIVYSDMRSERYNIPADEFLVCPVVELTGIKNNVHGTLRMEHAIRNESAIKVLRSEALPNGIFSWKSDKNMDYQIYENEIEIMVPGTTSAYTCTLPKNIGGYDCNSLSQAIFVNYKSESESQELTVYIYLMKTSHNLTDYLKHIHGNIQGVQRVVEFKENYTCSSLKSTDMFHVDLEWPESSWQEDGQCQSEAEKLQTSRKTYVLDRNIDFLNQPLGFRIAEFHLLQDMNGQGITKFRLNFNIDAVFINDQDTQNVFFFSEEFEF